jgi:hypothetical protein
MGFDLKRTPADKPLQAIVTAEALTITNTHFWGGRTVPCEMPDCEACNAAVPFRTHVYVSAFDPKTHSHFIFECTEHAARALAEYIAANKTLRGCYFSAARPKGSKNGKVCITTRPADLTRVSLPAPPNLILALSVIWRLPTPALRQAFNLDGKSRVRTDSRVTAQVYNQPDNQPEPVSMREILEGGNGDKITTGVLQ